MSISETASQPQSSPKAAKRTIKALCLGPEPERKRLLLKICAASLQEFQRGLQTELIKHLKLPADSDFEIESFEKEFEEWVIPTEFDHIEDKAQIRVQLKQGRPVGDASFTMASSASQPDCIASAADAACAAGEKCIVCLDNQPFGIHCEGEDKHFTCGSCLCHYTLASCEGPLGDFERTVLGGPGLAVESPPGSLPCPMFKQGCSCASLPRANLVTAMGSTEGAGGQQVLDTLLAAMARVAVSKNIQERAAQEAAEEAEAERLGKVAKARRAVQVALQRGQSVPCPICNEAWRKDDACMHMDCSKCGHKFCYVCGRSSTKGDCPRGSGCDAQSPFLERNPDWCEFSGHEALIEFQVRLMAFYVHVARYLMGRVWWDRLLEMEPTLLNNVIEGRSITLEEVDSAVEPPLFGRNKVDPTARRLEIARRKAEALRFLQPEVMDLRQEEEGPEADSQVSIFTELTGAEEEIAVFFLSSHGQDLPKAIEAFEAAKKSAEDVPRGGASSSRGPPRDEAITELAPPVSILVEGAGAFGRGVNGEYRQQGSHNDRPLYRQVGGQSVMYWSGGMWKINDEDSLSGWYYSVQSSADLPPERQWTTEGYRGPEVNPPPMVRHQGGQAQHEHPDGSANQTRPNAAPIASWRDCQIGERVRVLPIELAEGPTRASAANWTRSCADHAGQVGVIAQIDPDNTIQMRFQDNELLWYSVHSCTKTLEDTAEAQQLIQVWVVGAGGRGASLNGTFRQDGQHRGKPMYRKVGGGAVIYWSNFWKMSPSSLTGWFYSVLGDYPLPPSGPWTTHGYGGRDVLPAPEVFICEPLTMGVEEAREAALIGSYQQTGILNSRPKYVKQGGEAVICFNGSQWQVLPGEAQDPCYHVESTAMSPPAGRWAATEGGAETALVSRRMMSELSNPPEEVGEPIQRVADCHLGERVRILPLALAEGPTRESSASWTDACAARCGQEGTINLIDQDETIQVKFDDGRCLWFAARSCAKLGNAGNAGTPARVKVIVRGAGGRGARLDGTYRQDGDHNGRPLYRQVDGNGIVYCGPDSAWRISPGSLGGWFYSLLSASPVPPEGPWTTEGFSGKGVTPPPVVSLESDEAEAVAAPVARRRVLRGRGQVRGASSSSESEEEEEPAAGPAAGPASIVVTGAGGVGAHLNGTYRPCGVFKMRQKYRQDGGNAIIYFRERWKMNYQDDVDGWYYSVASTERFPPAGSWTTEGYDDGDADPAPMVVQHL